MRAVTKIIYAVDFDGCLCDEAYPDIGKPNKDLIGFLIQAQISGCKIILWTCRTGGALERAVEWCKGHGLMFDAVNDDVSDIKQHFVGSGNRKIYADVYIDDKAINYSSINGECHGKTKHEAFKYARNIAERRCSGTDAYEPIGNKQKDPDAMEPAPGIK